MKIYFASLKISLATIILLPLIIPFLIKPVNGLYDIEELEGLGAYCYLHADRAAQGENVVNDLIKSGLADSKYYDWSCVRISETLQAEENAESARINAFSEHCKYGNLTPSQYWECDRAGYSPTGILCLFEEDREMAKEYISEGRAPFGALDFTSEIDLSRAEPLTPWERVECENTGHEPRLGAEEEEED